MKKIILMAVVLGFLMGCGKAATQSEFYQHRTMYKSWDHMKFSLFGYRNVTPEEVQKAKEQGWWGEDVPHVPGM